MIVLRRDIPASYFEDHAADSGIGAAESSFRAWHSLAMAADWKLPQDIKAAHPKASILKAGRVVFNINYRLICKVNYREQIIEIRWFGHHSEYDGIDAESI